MDDSDDKQCSGCLVSSHTQTASMRVFEGLPAKKCAAPARHLPENKFVLIEAHEKLKV